MLAKAADVITYVEHGVCDMGVVGKDTILEHGSQFYEVLDLGFGRCRFALAAPQERRLLRGLPGKDHCYQVSQCRPRAFLKARQMDVRIIKIEGSVELAPLLGLSDAIVDIVETGTTLKENGLEVVEEIDPISARLIVNIASIEAAQGGDRGACCPDGAGVRKGGR